ncbi:MAG: glycosyltransferase family 2 protein [Bernardetiaceae bacterium]|jgi:hypothetical protein|nr:glycosyltransferase family 2 protein [Bernardetiaceae bacterium]
MKISGFTIVRNALKYDYPVVESITSILPICDEFVVCVGQSEDATRQLVADIGSPKLRIVDSQWDDGLRQGGRVLALETDKALAALAPDTTWGFYLQADEVVHEQYLEAIAQAAARHQHNPQVEGLLFNYTHFYGTYRHVGDSRRWYRHEVRLVRPAAGLRSYRDAQGFRRDGRKLHVMSANAHIYHYGWVKNPRFQQAKQLNFNRYWHSDDWVAHHVPAGELYDYSHIDSVVAFAGTHPAVMRARVAAADWDVDFSQARPRPRLKERLLNGLEHLTGQRWFEYKNYVLMRG